MDINSFKSGHFKKQSYYKSFMPALISHEWGVSDSQLISLLSQADRRLGELNAFSQLVPDADFFIKMHVSKEATLSSKIEGTRTNLEDVLQQPENIAPEKRDDWEEVQNYIKAMNVAIEEFNRLPISSRLLRNTHKILLQGVRDRHKLPGEFRKSQNWIGGASIDDAVFVPPHHQDLPELMSDLEIFINSDVPPVPDLIKIAIAHYQFETIHPFLDGNGRVGRLLITLYLVNKGLLESPTLYLSAFFEKYRSLYYDNLSRTRTHNDLTQWIKFFLEGVNQTAESSIGTFKAIIHLRKSYEKKILSLGRKAETAHRLLNNLYRCPYTDSKLVASWLGVGKSTSLQFINNFVDLGILHELTGYKRNRIFGFNEYVNLFK